ncbi:NADPH2:quinone reductase [Antricoccus suffuscus]|uniref:NADPH2:quinone reductase n=1 Tax=Antricoccus suffuscus TaxID=1629062 RepID=A0A2T0ZZW8_9ACTN|nr:zinc-binding dehydrogenase [Antricoccus suffuscus]PRZ41899.1 NADPH2:quinone reductase [Antricoccus suffuscus]
MKAAVAEDGTIRIDDVAVPEPGAGEVQIKVAAAGLNAADKGLITGHYIRGTSITKPTASETATGPIRFGMEVSGVVSAVGADVSGSAVGDEVMARANGAFAEYVVTPAADIFAKPAGLSFTDAAAVPVTFITAHDALSTLGGLQEGQHVLVNAVSSGVGVAALQLAKLLGAATIVGTARNRDRLADLAEHGIATDLALDTADPQFIDKVLDATDGHGIDVIVDSVGSPEWAQHLQVLAIGGRLVSVGRSGGTSADVDLDEVARKRVSLIGATFRTRSREETSAVVRRAADVIVDGFAAGNLKVIVDRVFPLEDVAQAESWMTSGKRIGKVVVELS